MVDSAAQRSADRFDAGDTEMSFRIWAARSGATGEVGVKGPKVGRRRKRSSGEASAISAATAAFAWSMYGPFSSIRLIDGPFSTRMAYSTGPPSQKTASGFTKGRISASASITIAEMRNASSSHRLMARRRMVFFCRLEKNARVENAKVLGLWT